MKEKEEILQRIVRYLILHTSSLSNLGLLGGKMGVAIFFYMYSRYTGKKHHSDFAGELIDEIYSEINTECSRDFKDGLAGICWGFEYLVRGGFIKGDTDDALKDIDPIILEKDVRRIKDISLETGLNGLAHYVLARCSGKSHYIIDNSYITELFCSMKGNNVDPKLTSQINSLLKKRETNYVFDLLDIIALNSRYKESALFYGSKIGIAEDGLAAIAIKLLNELSV